jgi:predicted kinase
LKKALLINGLPASGKSRLGRTLAAGLGLPILTLDAIKEALFDVLGTGDGERAHSRLLGRASLAAIWALLAEFPDGSAVIVEAYFGTHGVETVQRGLARAGIGRTAEIWCHARPETLARRYVARVPHRHAGHPGASFGPELAAKAATAEPLGLGPLLRVDTDAPEAVDADAVQRWAVAALGLG